MADTEPIAPPLSDRELAIKSNIILYPLPVSESDKPGFIQKIMAHMTNLYENINPVFPNRTTTPTKYLSFKESTLDSIKELIDFTNSDNYGSDEGVRFVVLTDLKFIELILTRDGLQCLLERSIEKAWPNPPSGLTTNIPNIYRNFGLSASATVKPFLGKVVFGIPLFPQESRNLYKLFSLISSRGVMFSAVSLSEGSPILGIAKPFSTLFLQTKEYDSSSASGPSSASDSSSASGSSSASVTPLINPVPHPMTVQEYVDKIFNDCDDTIELNLNGYTSGQLQTLASALGVKKGELTSSIGEDTDTIIQNKIRCLDKQLREIATQIATLSGRTRISYKTASPGGAFSGSTSEALVSSLKPVGFFGKFRQRFSEWKLTRKIDLDRIEIRRLKFEKNMLMNELRNLVIELNKTERDFNDSLKAGKLDKVLEDTYKALIVKIVEVKEKIKVITEQIKQQEKTNSNDVKDVLREIYADTSQRTNLPPPVTPSSAPSSAPSSVTSSAPSSVTLSPSPSTSSATSSTPSPSTSPDAKECRFCGGGGTVAVMDPNNPTFVEDVSLAMLDPNAPYIRTLHTIAQQQGASRHAHSRFYPRMSPESAQQHNLRIARHMAEATESSRSAFALDQMDDSSMDARVQAQYARSGFLGSTPLEYDHIVRAAKLGLHPMETHAMMVPSNQDVRLGMAIAQTLGIPTVGSIDRRTERLAMQAFQPTFEAQRQFESEMRGSIRTFEREQRELQAAVESLKCRLSNDIRTGALAPCPNNFRLDSQEFSFSILKIKADPNEIETAMTESQIKHEVDNAMEKLQKSIPGQLIRSGESGGFVSPYAVSQSDSLLKPPWLMILSTPLVEHTPPISNVHIFGNPIGASDFVSQIPAIRGCGTFRLPLKIHHHYYDPREAHARLIQDAPRSSLAFEEMLADQVRRSRQDVTPRYGQVSAYQPSTAPRKTRSDWLDRVRSYNQQFYSECDKIALKILNDPRSQTECCPTDSAETCCGTSGPRYRYKGIIEQKSKCSDSTIITEESRIEISTPTITTIKNVALQVTTSPTNILTRNRTRIYENLVPSICLRSVGLSFVTSDEDDRNYIEPSFLGQYLRDVQPTPALTNPSRDLALDVFQNHQAHARNLRGSVALQ